MPKKQPDEPVPYLEWCAEQKKPLYVMLRETACTMVYVGLGIGVKKSEKIRAKMINKILDSGEEVVSLAEQLTLVLDADIDQAIDKYATKHYDTWTASDVQMMEITNALAQKAVERLANTMQADGFISLAWDDKTNDFVYIPGPNYKG